MTQWSDMAEPPQVVVAFAQMPNGKPGAKPTQPVIRAAFAVVQTPAGWLVIQI